MKKTVRICGSLQPEGLRSRFDAIFEIARTRSVVQWESVALPEADVIVCTEVPDDAEHAVAICIGDDAKGRRAAGVVVRLEPSSLRLGTLLTALDLAAVRVLNAWDAKAKVIREVSVDSTFIYQLRHWVSLGPDKAGMAYTRVLAAMTRRPVTRKWIATDGGLNGNQADSLLAELQTRGALKVLDSAAMPLAPMPGQDRHAPAATTAFVGRLKRWLVGARSVGVGPTP